jgi:hemoglobin
VEPSIYEAAGGAAAFVRLADAWHARCLADPIVSHAFSHGFHPEHSRRLAAYWCEALGGPTLYSDSLGDETSVRRLHAGNGEHGEMDQAALRCFALALEDVGISHNRALSTALLEYFTWATATMASYPHSADDVAEGVAFAHWSWDGPQ